MEDNNLEKELEIVEKRFVKSIQIAKYIEEIGNGTEKILDRENMRDIDVLVSYFKQGKEIIDDILENR